MDIRVFGLDTPFSTLERLVDEIPDELEKAFNAPTKSYLRDQKAMACTPTDVRELPNSYVFVIDMPGLKAEDVKVQLEENMLVVRGERRRDDGEEGKYLRMERRMGKFMRKFKVPEDGDSDAISAVCQNGVLVVTVGKVPPPEPKRPRSIQVQIG